MFVSQSCHTTSEHLEYSVLAIYNLNDAFCIHLKLECSMLIHSNCINKLQYFFFALDGRQKVFAGLLIICSPLTHAFLKVKNTFN